jgi:hypothetical protein
MKHEAMTGLLLRATLGLLLPTVVRASNLILNADFDADLSNWTVGADGGTAVWDGAIGSPNAGSAHLTAGTGVVQTLTQCVALPSNLASSISLSANIYIFSDSTNTTGNGYDMRTGAYAGTTCSDASFYGGNSIILAVPTTTWTAVSNNFFPLPAGYQSMLVTIQVAGNLYYADYAFDHVSLTQVTDRIFGTGFEVNEGYQ